MTTVTFSSLKTKKARVEYLRDQLKNDDRWMLRGLLAIYERQTEDEKQVSRTTQHNGVGFSGVDAEICSSLAKQVIRKGGKVLLKQPTAVDASTLLSQKQIDILRAKMPKYAIQLNGIASARTTA